MCGIVGEIALTPVQQDLLTMLELLEYRGYDSAGLKLIGQPVYKTAGRPRDLIDILPTDNKGCVGIGHTRWATHGEPCDRNAHPHQSLSGKVTLVHNGTLENFRALKAKLYTGNKSPISDTDSEVFAELIDAHYQGDLLQAVRNACNEVRGTYGIVVMHEDHPGELVTGCSGSPIVLGVKDDGMYIASDETALVPFTKRVLPLGDGEFAVLTVDGFSLHSADGNSIERAPQEAESSVVSMQKGGYKHFMRKEIAEAPQVIIDTTRGRLLPEIGNVKLGGLYDVLERLEKLRRLTIVGCGSAHYAGLVGAWMLEEYARIPTSNRLGSEYRNCRILENGDSAVLAVSQSGSTLDTRMCVKHATGHGLLTLGIVNAVGSQIARETDAGVYNHAGPEIAVASTKAVISQMAVFAMLTTLLAHQRGMTESEGIEIVRALEELPQQLEEYLSDTSKIESVAHKYGRYDSMMFIGQGSHEAIAHESALKMREVAIKNTLGLAAGEMKHGSIALLHENYPVIALAPQGNQEIYELVCTNIEQSRARKAPVLAVGTDGDTKLAEIADDVLFVPETHPMLQPILSVVPMQLFAYYTGVNHGVNVDQPPNLAKSVTVA